MRQPKKEKLFSCLCSCISRSVQRSIYCALKTLDDAAVLLFTKGSLPLPIITIPFSLDTQGVAV